MTVEIGRLCVKLAGRDAGKECIIVDKVKENFVLIDGNTRRRKCNIHHLEFLPQKTKIKKGASHDEVMLALKELGVKPLERGKKFPKEKKAPKVEKPEEKKKLFSLKKKTEAEKKDKLKKSPAKKKKAKK